MRLVIIDYGSGNLRSAAKACERALLDNKISGEVLVSSDASALKNASHIILPGVGAFGDCMRGLKSRAGLLEALTEQVRENKKWFLGICVGMQLLFERGHEHGVHEGFGWLQGEVVKLTPDNPALKIPHMGWNTLTFQPSNSSFFTPFVYDTRSDTPTVYGGGKGAADHELSTQFMPPPLSPPASGGGNSPNIYTYFVHSYHAKCSNRADILATTDYGGEVVAMVGRDNIFGTQFHPEKSQTTGLSLLANFMKL